MSESIQEMMDRCFALADLDNQIRRHAAQGETVIGALEKDVLASGAMRYDFQVRVRLQRGHPSGQLFKAVLL